MVEFNPGDVVRLRSGGPAMTVKGVAEDRVMCNWFDEMGQLQEEELVIAQLEKF